MKNNYNPYTVPEDFFENSCTQAVAGFRSDRRKIRRGIAAMALALILVAAPALLYQHNAEIEAESEVVASNLADMYDYDIFLQINF